MARGVAAVLGTLTAFLVALLNPLAGLWLAIHTFTIKYTSQVMLEALPALTSALVVVAYERARANAWSRRWLALAALALGLTASSKYLHCVVGIVVVALACGDFPRHDSGATFSSVALAASSCRVGRSRAGGLFC